MSDSGLEALEAQQAVEAKLAEAGADQIRRHSFEDAPEAAPDLGTPAEEVSADQPRNDLGQFASEEPEIVEEPQAGDTTTPQGQDPAVQAILNKYGGDVDKALNAMVHLQRKNGEQSNELGDLRQVVSELSQLREVQQADLQYRQQNQPLDQGTVDWFDEQLMQNPQGAVEYARQQNNNLLFQRGMAQWKELQPYEAAVYTNNLQNQAMYQQMQQQAQANSQLPADANMHMALSNVRAENPEYVQYDDEIGTTLGENPFIQKAISDAYASGDRQQLEGALKTLYALAQRDTLTRNALAGDTPETVTTANEVVTPTTSETREPAPEPTQTDQFRALFNQEAERQRRGVWVAE